MVSAVITTAGGLDSLLTIKLMKQTEIAFKVVHFDIGLTYDKPIHAGQRISKYFGLEDLIRNGIEIDKINVAKEFYSYLLNIKDFSQYNACIEYRIFILQKAKEYMDSEGAQFIVSGDVLDQRPIIQDREALLYIDQRAAVEGLVFRPLSAKLLAPNSLLTKFPSLANISYDFTGFSEQRKLLADQLQIVYVDKEEFFIDRELDMGRKAFEIFERQKDINLSHLNRVGQHFKLGSNARCIIGRTPFESNYLKTFYDRLDKKDFSFSITNPRFLFGFVYGSSYPEEHETIALQIFRSVIACARDIQLYDSENLLLGSKKIEPLSEDTLKYYILYSNDIFCPVLDLKLQ
ncbi:MAG: hypothetical protein ACRCWI_02045 [Brevinema sp.]